MYKTAEAAAHANLKSLKDNCYPGRGIVLGRTPDGQKVLQIYWIMGRSENSRNRIFQQDGDAVRTKAFDESKMLDPSLIIYHPLRVQGKKHIVTNGDQTDTIRDALVRGENFESALATREYEPDDPNFTPRISGMVNMDGQTGLFELSILKSAFNDGGLCLRQFFHYEDIVAGFGRMITTYAGDGDPIPSFEGEPRLVKTFPTAEETADFYWNCLNADNRVSLLVRFIDPLSESIETRIINSHS